MPETEIKQESLEKRVVGALSALYFKQDHDELTGNLVRRIFTAHHGQEIELPTSEVKRLERNGALLPKGAKPEDAARESQARLDHYRGLRGDNEALGRHNQRVVDSSGGVVNVDAPADGSVADLASWIRENKPNADDTVALAEDDPSKAEKVLEAERVANDGNARATVEQRLSKLADSK